MLILISLYLNEIDSTWYFSEIFLTYYNLDDVTVPNHVSLEHLGVRKRIQLPNLSDYMYLKIV